MTETEFTLRQKLAAAHHIIHFMGCDDLLATHISVRIPGTDHLLVTPHNVPFEEVSASKLIKSDFHGNRVGDDNGYGLMRQAITIHGAVYLSSDTIMSAAHTHSMYGNAVAGLDCGFLFFNQHSLRFYGDIAYHDLEGLALGDEGPAMVHALSDKKIMILRNHGLFTTGKSLDEAIYRMYYFEKLCEMQIKTMSANSPIHPIPEDVCKKIKAQYDSILTPHLEFEVLTRRIEGLSPVDYRD